MGLGRYVKKAIGGMIRWAATSEPSTICRDDYPISSGSMGVKVSSGNLGDRTNGLSFTVYSATGGKVIQMNTYDPRTDMTKTSLYVITDKEDLGEELAQIITKESLCR